MSNANVFLQMPGIRGTGTGKTHQGWVTAVSYGHVTRSEMTLMRTPDSSTPHLLRYCVDGRGFDTVKLDFERDAKLVMRITMTDVIISSFSTGDPYESIELSFMKMSYSWAP